MENSSSFYSEAARPDFAALEAGVRTRLAQRRTLPPDAVQGIERLGRLVHVLRAKQHWSLEALAAQTGIPWLWLALLEQGLLLPTELTAETLYQLGQAFPPQHAGTNPAALFCTIAEHLRHLPVPGEEAPEALRDRVIRWLSPLWPPPLAGELVTAANTTAQEQVFYLDDGRIKVTCEWRTAYQDQPALLRIAWQAHLTLPGDLWVRFTRLNDPTDLLAEIRLGLEPEGEAVFPTPVLGFDPTREPWALTLLLKEPAA